MSEVIRVVVNGTERRVAAGASLADLLAELGAAGRGNAAAVNGEVVPRTRWPSYRLPEGASVEVVRAVQGG